MTNKFDSVAVGTMQRWWISVPFATIACNTVQEEKGFKRIVQIAPIFGKFEGKSLALLLGWLKKKSGDNQLQVELL